MLYITRYLCSYFIKIAILIFVNLAIKKNTTMSLLKKTIFFLLLCFSIFQCSPLDDNKVPTSIEVQNFIWKGLNLYYLWQNEIPDLADTRFKNQFQLNTFLVKQNNPQTLFENLLYQRGTVDRWSYLFDDYQELEQWLGGTSATNGMDFGLKYINNDSNKLFGYVRYVLPNSDAANKNLTRGTIFYSVNGVVLTDQNYSELYKPTITLQLADYDNGKITPNGKSITLNQTAYAENPIYLHKIITEGSQKIGYLMYNGFYDEYDLQLNEVFGTFKNNGVTDLVLDLRYNSGGSVQSAEYLASMITGQFTGQLLLRQKWNTKLEKYITDDNPNALKDNFVDKIENTPINSLRLNKVYVLTTKSSASASELVINSLKPYIQVIQIGETTTGKNVGSVTLYDAIDFSKEKSNKNHRYAMQPIVVKTVNKDGFGEYENGITPNIILSEDYGNLGILGDPNEPYLKTALNQINGAETISGTKFNRFSHKNFKDAKSLYPLKTEMYLNRLPIDLKLLE